MERKPNRWSCVATAFANCLNVPTASIWEAVGFDGSEIISGLQEPYNRRGIYPEEVVLALAKKQIYFLRFSFEIAITSLKLDTPFLTIHPGANAYRYFPTGVVIFEHAHAASRVNGVIIDPDTLESCGGKIIEYYPLVIGQ